ncbi:MAG: hypothetical protein ACREEP_21705 [Dongiaceae bacterium]
MAAIITDRGKIARFVDGVAPAIQIVGAAVTQPVIPDSRVQRSDGKA